MTPPQSLGRCEVRQPQDLREDRRPVVSLLINPHSKHISLVQTPVILEVDMDIAVTVDDEEYVYEECRRGSLNSTARMPMQMNSRCMPTHAGLQVLSKCGLSTPTDRREYATNHHAITKWYLNSYWHWCCSGGMNAVPLQPYKKGGWEA